MQRQQYELLSKTNETISHNSLALHALKTSINEANSLDKEAYEKLKFSLDTVDDRLQTLHSNQQKVMGYFMAKTEKE